VEQPGYHVVLEPDPEGGYVAVVPAFPGYYRQGKTAEEEALYSARDAIRLTIEDMRERGDAIPDPADELVRRVAVEDQKGSGHAWSRSEPDEFTGERDPLAWEGEGWS
jgi:predicted RNase H-like HicB family nuclease